MFASDTFFTPTSSPFRVPPTLRTSFKRKGSELPILSPLTSPPLGQHRFPSGNGLPVGSPARSSTYVRDMPKRRSSNPVQLVRSNTKSMAAFLLSLVCLGWLLLSGSMTRFRHVAKNESVPLYQTLHPAEARQQVPVRLPVRSSSASAHVEEEPLTLSQELAALTLFLTSGRTHILPVDLDPQQPLDPDLVLDTLLPSSTDARQAALRDLETECWQYLPVVVFGKHDTLTRQAEALLHSEDYFGHKGQGIATVYVDRRPDSLVLNALLTRLTLRTTLPVVLVGGVPIGSFNELQLQHDEGHLLHLLERVGADLGRDAERRHYKERQRELTLRKAAV